MVQGVQAKPKRTSLMPNCTQNEFGFPSFDRRKIEASFEGGDVSSDGVSVITSKPATDYRIKTSHLF
jgi:hypothetical protein